MNPHTSDAALPLELFRLDARLTRLLSWVYAMKRYSQRASALTGLDSVITWCQVALRQGYGRVREFVHGGLEYQATLNKVQELEEQLQQLLKEKEALQKLAADSLKPVTQNQCSACCQCQGSLTGRFHPDLGGSAQGPVPPASLQPPPPPPPPPPAPPPPPPKMKTPFRIMKKSASQAKDNSKENKAKDSRPIITAEELQRVKLRKPEDRVLASNKEKSSPKEKSLCGDLRRMALRKTQSAFILRDVGNVLSIQAEDVARQKQHLRKTTLKRSPGGTPILDRKRRRESGQGLTPMMNKALRLKFQTQSPCLSSESDSSPISSPDSSASVGPTVNRSPLGVTDAS